VIIIRLNYKRNKKVPFYETPCIWKSIKKLKHALCRPSNLTVLETNTSSTLVMCSAFITHYLVQYEK